MTRTRIALVAVAVALTSFASVTTTAQAAQCGKSTRQLQQRLTDIGYPVGKIDGCPGAATTAGVIAFQRAQGLAGDGVVGPATRRALKDPRRVTPISSGGGRRVEIDLRRQLLLRVEGGKVRAVYAVSSGKPGNDTPRGRFKVYRKEQRSWSVPYKVWMPWASYFTGGIAVHAGDVKPYPASHGCVRVPAAFAQQIYGFMTMGTPVVVA